LGKPNGFAGQVEKPLRYMQPPGSGVRAYFPAVPDVNWLQILSDPAIPLIITEGEIKALTGTVNGYPTVGLGGVESWRSANKREPFLKDLEAVVWKTRNVYICYDSDAALKPQVADAALRLAEELGRHGAIVYDAGLPSIGEKKVGLDDFLVMRGARELANHLRGAPEFNSIQRLHDFNKRFMVVRALMQVYEESTGHFYDPTRFSTMLEAHQTYYLIRETKDGSKMEKRSVAKDWMQWPNRREVTRVGYSPGKSELITSVGKFSELNLWRGWGCTPKRGDIKPWQRLFAHLLKLETSSVAKWVEQWFAYPLQHPGTKLFTAVAIWGAAQGTGKTLLGETLLRIYGSNGQRIGAKQLSSSYNSWAQRKQFILGDEITGNDNRSHTDELKGLLTGETVRINEKYMPEYDLPNCVNFYFTSNHPDAYFIDDNDRRYTILEAPDQVLEPAFYDEYDAWMRGAGPSALFNHLLHVDCTDFNPRGAAVHTSARNVMVETGRSEVGRFISIVMHDREQAEVAFKIPRDVELFSCRELLRFFDPRSESRATERAVSVELMKQGAVKTLGGSQLSTPQGRVRVFAVRNPLRWKKATDKEVRNAFMSRILPSPKY